MSLAREFLLSAEPVELARRIGMEPDGWQAEALGSTARRQLYNCSRQSGKSTVAGIRALHTALYRPQATVLMVSRAWRQSQELLSKARSVYAQLRPPVPLASETTLNLSFANGSRIISLPGQEGSIRGYSADLLIIDEAARVPDELYASVRPMLSVSRGKLIALSTPFGARGWWYEAWSKADSWERYKVTVHDVPRISSEEAERYREEVGQWWYRQEFECEFLEEEYKLFSREDVEGMFDEEVSAWAV